ncbi:MAG: hypothetical protein AVO35_06680 [Candidatus Aegiribacteria sp. MLS_C]|nr:MAG: hypothetical protein AVO35_06680 [Candidatus Aegiribacteria sp. MLS_C]
MTVSISVLLSFPGECVGEPVISGLVRECGLEVNILHARISPSEEGRMLARLEGTEDLMERGLDYLSRRGVGVTVPGTGFIWDEDLCVHCGACAGICPGGAFTVDHDTLLVSFDMSGCILCGLCMEVCYYGAVQSVEDHMKGGSGK